MWPLRRAPTLDIEQAQSPSSSTAQPESGRRSARIVGGSAPEHAWGDDPEPRRRRQSQGGNQSPNNERVTSPRDPSNHPLPQQSVGLDPTQPQLPAISETQSQPPSVEEETTSERSSMSVPTAVGPLQRVSTRWEVVPEGDRGKIPSQLSRELLQSLFPVAEGVENGERFSECAKCNQALDEIESDTRYVRCGHAMHLDCVASGGVDDGCPTCPLQIRSFPTRLPESSDCVESSEGGLTCSLCSAVLTQETQLAILPCGHGLHKDCIPKGSLAHGCPNCRRSVPTYGCWREFTDVDPPQTMAQRDRLLSELFHVHPDLWDLFAAEMQGLQQLQSEANFDLDGWLNDFRTYHNSSDHSRTSINTRRRADYTPNLDIQDPEIHEVQVNSDTTNFYRQIVDILNTSGRLTANQDNENQVRALLERQNVGRPGSTNEFQPNFWLPHQRMYTRRNSDEDRMRVSSYIGKYLRKYHNHPEMASICDLYDQNAAGDGSVPVASNGHQRPQGGTPASNGGTQQAQGGTRQAQGGTRQAQGGTQQAQGGTPASNGGTQQALGGTRQTQGGTRQAQGGTQQAQGGLNPQEGVAPRYFPRPGWVNDGGQEKEMESYRMWGGGCQVLLKTPAPIPGWYDYEWVASSVFGGEDMVVSTYESACISRGVDTNPWREGSIDLLRSKSKDKVRCSGRSVVRRGVWEPPVDGYLNAPIQHLMIRFTDEDGTHWYSKATLERAYGRRAGGQGFVNDLLSSLYNASGLSRPSFVPSESRTRRRPGARSNIENMSHAPQSSNTSSTQPVHVTPPPPYRSPTPPSSSVPASTPSTIEQRLSNLESMVQGLSRLETMVQELLNAQRNQSRTVRFDTPESMP